MRPCRIIRPRTRVPDRYGNQPIQPPMMATGSLVHPATCPADAWDSILMLSYVHIYKSEATQVPQRQHDTATLWIQHVACSVPMRGSRQTNNEHPKQHCNTSAWFSPWPSQLKQVSGTGPCRVLGLGAWRVTSAGPGVHRWPG